MRNALQLACPWDYWRIEHLSSDILELMRFMLRNFAVKSAHLHPGSLPCSLRNEIDSSLSYAVHRVGVCMAGTIGARRQALTCTSGVLPST